MPSVKMYTEICGHRHIYGFVGGYKFVTVTVDVCLAMMWINSCVVLILLYHLQLTLAQVDLQLTG